MYHYVSVSRYVTAPYAPLLKKVKLGKALILNGIRAFLFEVKQM